MKDITNVTTYLQRYGPALAGRIAERYPFTACNGIHRQDAKNAKEVLASAAKILLGDGRLGSCYVAKLLRRVAKVTSNRYVNETENRTLTTPRQRPEDARDAAAGRVFLSAFPMLLCEVARYVARAFTRVLPFLAFLASWR